MTERMNSYNKINEENTKNKTEKEWIGIGINRVRI